MEIYKIKVERKSVMAMISVDKRELEEMNKLLEVAYMEQEWTLVKRTQERLSKYLNHNEPVKTATFRNPVVGFIPEKIFLFNRKKGKKIQVLGYKLPKGLVVMRNLKELKVCTNKLKEVYNAK